MKIKLSYTIDINPKDYPKLTQKQIKEIVKQYEFGDVSEYIMSMVIPTLEDANYDIR